MAALSHDPHVTDATITLDHGDWRVRRTGVGWRRYQAEAAEIRDWAGVLAEVVGIESSIIRIGEVPWRISPIQAVDGLRWFALRRGLGGLPDFRSLKLPLGVAETMLRCGQVDGSRAGGLVVVSGPTGAGKTTLASALFAAWLAGAGETGIAIEDPPELPMQGRHGENGYCFQIDAGGPGGFASALVRSLRWRPRHIYLGEIRDPEGAVQLMRAAATGHVTLATLHAPSAVGAAERILGLLAQKLERPGIALAEAIQLFAHVHPSKSVAEARDGLRPVLVEVIDPSKDVSVIAGLRQNDPSVLKDASMRQNRAAAPGARG